MSDRDGLIRTAGAIARMDMTPEPAEETQARERGIAVLTYALAREFAFDPARWFSVSALISVTLSAAGLTITPAEVAASDAVTVSRDFLRTTILAWAEREFGARGIAATATLFAALRGKP